VRDFCHFIHWGLDIEKCGVFFNDSGEQMVEFLEDRVNLYKWEGNQFKFQRSID